jgi:branched-chain amino acid transport system ATP-binding protein
MLEIDGLRSGYGSLEVLHGIDLVVGEREIVSVVGPNGAGKTTLVQTISGLIPIQAGSIRFEGDDIVHLSSAKRVRAGIAQVPEGAGVFRELSVLENLQLTRAAAERVDAVVDRFPILGERAQQTAGLLSGGERQMLGIARALLLSPRLLILDEPSFGLAPKVVAQVLELLVSESRARDMSVLVVEQNVEQSLSISDRAYLLQGGECVLSGDAAEMLASDSTKAIYLSLGGADEERARA